MVELAAQVHVDGRHFSVDVTVSGTIRDVAGVPVKVTLYRGEPIHVEGPGLSFDTDAAPTSSALIREGGVVVLVGGTVLGGAALVVAVLGHPRRQPAA